MIERILVLHHTDKHTLATVRCVPNLMAATDGDRIWLRGIPPSGKTDLAIQQLPAQITYTLDPQNRLFPVGGQTPVATLKALNWQPVSEFIPVELPVSVLPGRLQGKHSVRIIPSDHSKPGVALLTSLSVWKVYAESAPEIRLYPLQFAVSANEEVFITGNPMVPLPGKEYWQQGSLLLPCGYDFDPPLLGQLLMEKIQYQEESLILFHTNGSWEQIPVAHFVPASRSAIRLTEVPHAAK